MNFQFIGYMLPANIQRMRNSLPSGQMYLRLLIYTCPDQRSADLLYSFRRNEKIIETGNKNAKYIVTLDPLYGSSTMLVFIT